MLLYCGSVASFNLLYTYIIRVFGKVLARGIVVAAVICAVAAANMVGQMAVGFQIDVAGKGFIMMLALRAAKAACRASIGLQDETVWVHDVS